MTLLMITVFVALLGFFFATVVYKHTYGDWAVNVGMFLMGLGAASFVLVALFGFYGQFWRFVESEIAQLRMY